jgi:choice-of-anchor C domain-containing protein
VPNANWIATPNVVIPAGTYTVIDSDPSTWSQNSGSGGQGFAAVTSSTGTAQNLVTNGSFETATVDPGSGLISLVSGSTAIAHWTVGGAGIDYIGGFWQPAEGKRSLDLSALDPGSIQQGFGTIPGWQYLVTFALAGNSGGGPTVKSLRVSAGGQSKDFSFDTTGRSTTNMGWTVKSWTFTATSAWTVLQFQALTPGAYGPALDNVRVTKASPLQGPNLLLLSSD